MKSTIYLLFFVCMPVVYSVAQNDQFPNTWKGNWKGDLMIYSSRAEGNGPAQVISMELNIQPLEVNRWTWEITYNMENENTRAYELIKDSVSGQWVIDEKNGIKLPQTQVGGRIVSSFSVMGNLLICYYWLEKDVMNMEIHVTSTEAQNKTGLGTEESPEVGNHFIGTFQKAVLYRN